MKKVKTKNQVIKTILISLCISVVVMFITVNENNFNLLLIDRIIICTAFLSFLMFHFTVGPKKLYNFIIDNRYKIAGIFVLITTILGYSGSSNCALTDYLFETEKSNMIFGLNGNTYIHSDEYNVETLIAVARKKQ